MKERARIDSHMRIVDGLIASIERRGASAVSEMRVPCIDPEFVYSIRRTIEERSASVTAMFERAEQNVAAADARANRPPFLIFHGTDKECYRNGSPRQRDAGLGTVLPTCAGRKLA